MDSYVDDELYLYLCHRLLKIRHSCILLAPLPILRYSNPHPSTLMHHSRMVPITTPHGVFTMPAADSIVGWNPRGKGGEMPHQRIDLFLLDSIDTCLDRRCHPYPPRY